jgi:hypothetical protein
LASRQAAKGFATSAAGIYGALPEVKPSPDSQALDWQQDATMNLLNNTTVKTKADLAHFRRQFKQALKEKLGTSMMDDALNDTMAKTLGYDSYSDLVSELQPDHPPLDDVLRCDTFYSDLVREAHPIANVLSNELVTNEQFTHKTLSLSEIPGSEWNDNITINQILFLIHNGKKEKLLECVAELIGVSLMEVQERVESQKQMYDEILAVQFRIE